MGKALEFIRRKLRFGTATAELPGVDKPAMNGHFREKFLVSGVLISAGMCLGVQAMERWVALSQLESGDNDRAVGVYGEVSRYQIKPDVWKHYATPESDWQKPADALAVAREVMDERCASFERAFHRAPTDFEFYILWNAPSQIEHPSNNVTKRAERFCNLVSKP